MRIHSSENIIDRVVIIRHLYYEGLLKRQWAVSGGIVTLEFQDGEMAVLEAAKNGTQNSQRDAKKTDRHY